MQVPMLLLQGSWQATHSSATSLLISRPPIQTWKGNPSWYYHPSCCSSRLYPVCRISDQSHLDCTLLLHILLWIYKDNIPPMHYVIPLQRPSFPWQTWNYPPTYPMPYLLIYQIHHLVYWHIEEPRPSGIINHGGQWGPPWRPDSSRCTHVPQPAGPSCPTRHSYLTLPRHPSWSDPAISLPSSVPTQLK